MLGTVWPVTSVGSSQFLNVDRRTEVVDGTSLLPVFRSKMQLRLEEQRPKASWSLCRGHLPKCALTASEQPEIEEKRRVAWEPPAAQSARNRLEQEVAALAQLERAYRRQHKAVVDSCVCWLTWRKQIKEQEDGVQQASVEAALGTSAGSWSVPRRLRE